MTAGVDEDDELGLGSDGDAVRALQHDLFGLGFEPGRADGSLGPRTEEALKHFQWAARGLERVRDLRGRVRVAVTYRGAVTGELDAETVAELWVWKKERVWWLEFGGEHTERRVRVKHYGSLPRGHELLVSVAGRGQRHRLLHKLAAKALEAMSEAAISDGLPPLLVASGWRAHRWRDIEHYREAMQRRYGSAAKGTRWVAYASAHETGLAVDFGAGGLEPKSATVEGQRLTPLHRWLVKNAYRFGWRPYLAEPWHWEFPLSFRAWETGVRDWDAPAPSLG